MSAAASIVINLPGYPFNNLESQPTIAALRAVASVSLANGSDVTVDAGVTPEDGLGGVFSWVAASLTTDDGTVIVKPNDKTALQAGRWIATMNPVARLNQVLALPTGAALSGRNRIPGTFQNRTVAAALDDTAITAFEGMTPAQTTAVRAKTATTGEAEAINVALTQAGTDGRAVDAPSGLYDLRVGLVVPPLASLRGEGPSFPNPTFDPGFTFKNGTVFAKKHTGDAITMTGGGPYSVSGELSGFAITSDRTAYAGGRGIVVNNVGSFRIKEIRGLGIGGDIFVFGTGAGDITGQGHVDGLYGNNPTGKVYVNRSKWIKMTKCEADGGTHSYYADNAANGTVAMFHLEGASLIAAEFVNASKNHTMRDGFVGLTVLTATHAFKLASFGGNTDLTFDTIHVVGHSTATGAEIGASTWRSRWTAVTFDTFQLGFLDNARGTEIIGSKFYTCATAIRTAGYEPRYDNLVFDGTSGLYAIEFTATGNGGHVVGCVTDKPFRPAPVALIFTTPMVATTSATLTVAWTGKTGPYTITFSDGSTRLATLFNGSAPVSWTGAVTATAAASALNLFGDYGTTIIRDNTGYRTEAKGKTQVAVATGVPIPHTLATWPYTSRVWGALGVAVPNLTWAVDGTNITPTFTGGGTFVLEWDAASAGANP